MQDKKRMRKGESEPFEKEEAKKKKASVKTSVVTGPQGLLQEAPVEKASLLGSAAKK